MSFWKYVVKEGLCIMLLAEDQGSDRKILDLIEKIRSCKPYLQKRLKIIEESGQTKLLREEVQDISYWLEIAQEVRADL